MAIRKNLQVDTAGMRPLSPGELGGYAGIEGPVEDARIADITIDGIECELVLCDAQLGLFCVNDIDGEAFETHGWTAEGSRFSRELLAVEVMLRAKRGSIHFSDLESMGLEHVVGQGSIGR